MSEGIPNHPTTWSSLMEELVGAAESLGKQKNTKEQSKVLLYLKEKIAEQMEVIKLQNHETIDRLTAEDGHLKETVQKQQESAKNEQNQEDQNEEEMDESLSDSDDEKLAKLSKRKRRSTIETNLNLISVAKK